MMGVQAEELDKLISSVKSDVSDVKAELSTLNNLVSKLSEIFKNNGVTNISNNLHNLYDGQSNIANTLESYVELLTKVNTSYRSQEEIFSNALKIVTKD